MYWITRKEAVQLQVSADSRSAPGGYGFAWFWG